MHYNQDYFDWQKNIGAIGGYANLFKFTKYINTNDNVIDFGCGGGFLINNISCKNKIGTEINDFARENAKRNGILVYKYSNEVEDNWADVITSNHALEHTFQPLDELKVLYKKLKKDGRIILFCLKK